MKMNTDVSNSGSREQIPTLPAAVTGVAARLVSYEELRDAGWSKGMINKFLGGTWRSYSLAAVEAAESHPKFRGARARAVRERCGQA